MFNQLSTKIMQLIACVLISVTFSCQKEQKAPANDSNASISSKLSYGEIKVSSNASSRESAVNATAPTISKVISLTLCDNCSSTSQVNIPYVGQQNSISILGSNFTSSGRSIKITDLAGNFPTTYGFAFLSWSDSEIKIQTGCSLSATPMSLKIEIERSDGLKTNINIIVSPVISGKSFNSEPYVINRKRIEMNMSPLPHGLYIQGPSLNANWTPKVGNVWLFDSPTKLSLVTSVSSRVVPVSSNKAGSVVDLIYEVGTVEWVNGKDANMSRQIIIRRTTTVFTNNTKSYYYELRTPINSAFGSVVNGLIAKRYYN